MSEAWSIRFKSGLHTTAHRREKNPSNALRLKMRKSRCGTVSGGGLGSGVLGRSDALVELHTTSLPFQRQKRCPPTPPCTHTDGTCTRRHIMQLCTVGEGNPDPKSGCYDEGRKSATSVTASTLQHILTGKRCDWLAAKLKERLGSRICHLAIDMTCSVRGRSYGRVSGGDSHIGQGELDSR